MPLFCGRSSTGSGMKSRTMAASMRLAVTVTIFFISSLDAEPILEVFTKNCAACHSAKTRTCGFSVASLDSVIQGGGKRGRAVVAGHPENSPLIQMLKGELAPRTSTLRCYG